MHELVDHLQARQVSACQGWLREGLADPWLEPQIYPPCRLQGSTGPALKPTLMYS